MSESCEFYRQQLRPDGCTDANHEFELFGDIEKLTKKIWPAKSVLGKRFKQASSKFYKTFRPAGGRHALVARLRRSAKIDARKDIGIAPRTDACHDDMSAAHTSIAGPDINI